MAIFIIALCVGALCAIVGFFTGAERSRPVTGAVLGFLLGPFGLLILLALPDTAREQREQRHIQAALDRAMTSANTPEPVPPTTKKAGSA